VHQEHSFRNGFWTVKIVYYESEGENTCREVHGNEKSQDGLGCFGARIGGLFYGGTYQEVGWPKLVCPLMGKRGLVQKESSPQEEEMGINK